MQKLWTGADRMVELLLPKPGDRLSVYVNNGQRKATVLAVVENEALIEYEMPDQSTALRVLFYPGPSRWQRASYRTLPLKWLRAIVYDGLNDWIARPQQTHPSDPLINSPMQRLFLKTEGEEPAVFVQMKKSYVNSAGDFGRILYGVFPVQLDDTKDVVTAIQVTHRLLDDRKNPLLPTSNEIRWQEPPPMELIYEEGSFEPTGEFLHYLEARNYRKTHVKPKSN